MPLIQLPDGHTAEFPEDMSMDDIKSVVQKKYPPVNDQQHQPNLLERAGQFAESNINNPIEQNIVNPANSMAAGFEQGIGNIIPGLANLGISGINALGGNIPKVPMFNFAPNDINAQAGNLASFFIGPGALFKSLGKIPELASTAHSAMKIPIIASALGHATNIMGKSPIASRLVGNSLLGGAYSPDHPLIGMGLGLGAGALGEGINKGVSGIKNSLENSEFLKNVISKFNPFHHAKQIENELSHGTNSIDNNSNLLSGEIRNAYNMRNQEAGIFLNHALDQAGNEKIYKKVDPLISTSIDKSKSTINKIKDLNVGNLYNSFKSNPTFNNAHILQSELGTMIGDLEKKPYKTPDESNQLGLIKSARDQLKDDISSFLKKRDQNSNMPIYDKYQRGIDLYRENVAPYLSDKKLREIVRGGKTNIKNIHSVFNTPTNIVDKNGIEKIGPINKIMQDLPKSSKDRILFNAIGGNQSDAKSLLKQLQNARSKGYGNYFSPEIDQAINSLNIKLRNKDMALTGGKIAGLGTIAGLTGNALSHFF